MEEQRKTHRYRALLTANFHAEGFARKATVRNLSSSGALIETAQPPGVGTAVELSRGDLRVGGTVVWVRAGECGLHFDTPILLDQWLPRSMVSGSQLRVDTAVARIRAGEALDEDDAQSTRVEADHNLGKRIIEELNFVARLLETLGDELVEDPYVAVRHATKLQTLDIAMQILGHLGTVLEAPDPRSVIANIGMDDLRRRLTRKAL